MCERTWVVGSFHLIRDDVAGAFRTRLLVRALCGKQIASENGEWEFQYEGQMIVWMLCRICAERLRESQEH
jgi:hypothetical protein